MNNTSLSIVRTKLVKEYNINLTKERIFGIEGAEYIFDKLIGGSTLEKVAVICLDSNNKAINASVTNIGTDKKVEIVPAEIFRVALLSNSSSIIICHNHPSGDLEPSLYDIEMTKKIGYIGSILKVRLIDSLIIGDNGRCLSIRSKINRNGEI